ncbi:zonular occludens toxin domain-containing protein [Geobacter grbiciae]|uniref:zonular occludens toxin domain-containing protein n=1 Tax=Geobacter grbiciae TaxID=155042 RepID=UPI001C021A07|nr:zonular occludens toxin domain-containing protein [Geobacter grbiciae]MBT1074457.1 zonular occludens toxin domain-containing protein [Geobacter grbiciae]
MIEVQQGTPGSGKSAAAVARAILHLKKGGVVAANFSLVDGWALEVAKRSLLSRFSEKHFLKLASSLHKRFYRVDSLSAIRSIDPRAESVGLYQDDGKYSEGNGLLILDEAQLVFNSRRWDKNMGWIEFFTQHRKLGWNVILIAHTIEMIDSQIRPLAEYESRFRNLQKLKFPVLGLPMSPFPLFLVIRRYAGLGAGASVIADRDLYPLPLWAARLYDSLEVFSQDSWTQDTPPRLCGSPPPPLCGGGGGVVLPPSRVSSLSPDCLWSKWENQQLEPS